MSKYTSNQPVVVHAIKMFTCYIILMIILTGCRLCSIERSIGPYAVQGPDRIALYNELNIYMRQNLWQLSSKERVRAQLLIDRLYDREKWPLYIAGMWKNPESKQYNIYVLIEGQEQAMFLSRHKVFISISAKECTGRVPQEITIGGYQALLHGFEVYEHAPVIGDVLVIIMRSPWEGNLIDRQYYGWSGPKQEWVLIRRGVILEGSDKENMACNAYGSAFRNVRVGPENIIGDMSECIVALSSEDIVDVLGALFWLASRHEFSKGDTPPYDIDQIRMDIVKTSIWNELRESPNEWIRQGVRDVESNRFANIWFDQERQLRDTQGGD